MISINHVFSSRSLPSGIFDALFARMVAAAPADWVVTRSARPDRKAAIRHYHRPHREFRLIGPAVTTIHHDPLDSYRWLRLSNFLPRWREADRVICLNSGQREVLSAHGITRTEIIPHGIDRSVLPLPGAPRRHHGRVRLGLVSKRYARAVKGETRLASLIRALDPARFAFVLAGEGRWRDAEEARLAGFEVESFEGLPYRLFGELYRRIDVLLILSEHEGGPACLPEALGSGVPAAALPVGMVPDWLRDGVNGIALDHALFVEQIAALADPGQLDALNNGAFALAATVPSWDTILARQIDLYRSVMAERS